MVLLRRVALPQVSHPAPGRVALLQLHGTFHISRPPIPSVRAGVLQGPCGYSGSPHRPDHDGLVYHSLGDNLDDTRTRLQHTQDELTAAQSYVHHLETELHERDEQLEAS
jgi:hypothetical protein